MDGRTPSLLIDIAFGMPALGWAPRAPTMAERWAPPECSIADLEADSTEHNRMILQRVGPCRDKALDQAAWTKTQEELESQAIIGPFTEAAQLPFNTFRLLRRFGTWEQHGWGSRAILPANR